MTYGNMFKDIFLSYSGEERRELINSLLKWSSSINEENNGVFHLFQNYMMDLIGLCNDDSALLQYKWFHFEYLNENIYFRQLVDNELKTNLM